MTQDIFAELSWRGLVYQTTDDKNLQTWLNEKPRTVYSGFDPTAESLHVGNLMPLKMLHRFQKAGHRVIALVGGATGMIGDPTGKSDERNLLDEQQLQRNIAGIEQQIRETLDESGDNPAIVVNNYDWIRNFSYIEFLRDVGKNFPVNVMMAKESIRNRLEGESGISYTEFSYMLLQAYDFVHLFQEYQCELQIGGSDQWGNITAGIDLGRRMCGVQLYGLTNPLLTKSDGTKMGKTESGAIWLSPDRTSPYDFYQYWKNVSDEDAGKCVRFLTDLNEDEVDSLDKATKEEPHRRVSLTRLASEVTRLVHGEQGLNAAEKATGILFGAEFGQLSDSELVQIFEDVASCEIDKNALMGDGLALVEAFVITGLSKSKGEARRTIAQGGAYVNNRRIEDAPVAGSDEVRQAIDYRLTLNDLASESMIVLRSGRKKYALLRVVDQE